jgi:hypothetical protein
MFAYTDSAIGFIKNLLFFYVEKILFTCDVMYVVLEQINAYLHLLKEGAKFSEFRVCLNFVVKLLFH